MIAQSLLALELIFLRNSLHVRLSETPSVQKHLFKSSRLLCVDKSSLHEWVGVCLSTNMVKGRQGVPQFLLFY